jgi:ferredoxin-NADP reductase
MFTIGGADMALTASLARRWPKALTRVLTTPFDLEDYLTLVNPLWSLEDIRARVLEVRRETADAATVVMAVNGNWPGHRAGQHVRIGVEIDGVRHQRPFSLSSAPGDDYLTITVKRNGDGLVSNYIVDQLQPGSIVHLSAPAGDFHQGDRAPGEMLMLGGGSGITPLRAMLHDLHRQGWQGDVTLLYYNQNAEATIFRDELDQLAAQWPSLTLHHFHADQGELFSGEQLARVVPDYQRRELFLCGPPPLMDLVTEFYADQGLSQQLHSERFSAPARQASADGGRVRFSLSNAEAMGTGTESVLELAESVGLNPEHGCRMGICHTCVCKLNSGRLRNLHNGEVFDAEGEQVRICMHAPEGDVELDI